MTGEQRQQIRQAIDQHQRERRQRFIDTGELDVCVACGCDWEQSTRGCRSCHDRHRRRERRLA